MRDRQSSAAEIALRATGKSSRFRFGEGYAVACAFEQQCVEFVFELFDLLREGALCDAERACGLREAEAFGQSDEVSDLS